MNNKRSAKDSKWSPGHVPLKVLAGLSGDMSIKEVNFRSVELPVLWLLAVSCHKTEARDEIIARLASHDYHNLSNLISLDRVQPVDDLIQDYLLASVLKKSVNVEVDCDPELVAREKSLWAEDQCRLSNERFAHDSFTQRTKNVLSLARDIFRKVLGPFNFDAIAPYCRFGPGTSSSCRKSDIHLYGKLSADIDVTDQAYSWMSELLIMRPDLTVQAMDPSNYFPDLTYSIGGIMRFVDKTAKEKRQIVVEPHGNMCLQLGAGGYIASRLAMSGLPKHRQADINQQLAFESSMSNRLATWDLKCGSGTICKSLIHFLCDPSWRKFLDDIRSHYVYEETLEDGLACTLPIYLEKFSEMGNGFTFELETLVFWSLMRASLIYDGISDKDSYVFGDDLLFPREGCPGMLKLFTEVGLTVNLDKSFTEGPFRESCGGDFYKGNYVRPFFFKEERYDALALIGVANKLRRWAARATLYGCHENGSLLTEVDAPFCDSRAKLAWLYIVDLLKRSHVPIVVGSYDRGDTVLWAHPEEDEYFDRCGYVYTREESRINIGNYQKAAYCAALNNSYSRSVYYLSGKTFIYKSDCEPGSLPKVRRPDQAMRCLCENTDAYLGPYDAPGWA